MADKKLVETIHGKRYKYEIYKSSGSFGSASFSIYRDGSYWKAYDSLAKAVEVARDAG